jgi:hypothetical protein
MQSLNVVLWRDCRGGGIEYFLKQKISCKVYKYEVHELGRFNESPPGYLTEKTHNLPIEILKKCDVFIYQFLDKNFLKYSTDPDIKDNNIFAYLNKYCIKIGMHGVYMDCFWPITSPIKPTQVDRIFAPLKDKSTAEIIKLYNTNVINFFLKERFEDSIEYTLSRENKWKDGFETDTNHHIISSVKFIKNNYKKTRLFFTHCHPTAYIFIDQVNQILELLNIDGITLYDDICSGSMVYPNIPSGNWPDSKYVGIAFDTKFKADNIKINEQYYINLLINNRNK